MNCAVTLLGAIQSSRANRARLVTVCSSVTYCTITPAIHGRTCSIFAPALFSTRMSIGPWRADISAPNKKWNLKHVVQSSLPRYYKLCIQSNFPRPGNYMDKVLSKAINNTASQKAGQQYPAGCILQQFSWVVIWTRKCAVSTKNERHSIRLS